MATPLGLLAIGTNDSEVLCIDAETGLLLLADQKHGAIEIPMDLPLLAELSEALDGAIATGRRHSTDDSTQALGAEVDLPGGGILQVIARGGQYGTALALAGGPVVPLANPLVLLQVAAEVRCLVIRASSQALERRQALEATLRQATAAAAPQRVAK